MQIEAKACSLGSNYIFIPGLCANQGDNGNRGPAIENGTKWHSRSTCCHLALYGPGDSTSICLFNFPEGLHNSASFVQ